MLNPNNGAETEYLQVAGVDEGRARDEVEHIPHNEEYRREYTLDDKRGNHCELDLRAGRGDV